MTLNSVVIRVSAGLILMTGALLYADQSGWFGGVGNAQGMGQDLATHAGDSRGDTAPPPPVAPALPQIVQGSGVRLPISVDPVAPWVQIVPASFEGAADAVPALPRPQAAPDLPALGELGLSCDVEVSASALPSAIVALDVMAPCHPSAPVRIVHSGLRLDARTDALGLLTLDIPAFETPARFSVRFADGIERQASIALPDLADVNRIGLTWEGDAGLELHALEFGAGFGSAGHVWANAPGHAGSTDGGFHIGLHGIESHAEIYTLPRRALRADAAVRLSIDAPVTAANCTRDVAARTLRTEAAGPVAITDLQFRVPPCDATGDVLVLQNLLEDLRLAAN